MMEEKIKSVIDELKKTVDQNGPDYLTREPYKVYESLKKSDGVSEKTSALILYALINGIQSAATPDVDPVLLSKKIQTACSLNKKAADFLSAIFLGLYSKENEMTWAEKDMAGLKQFLEDKLVCEWDGSAVWDVGNGTVDCYYQAEIVLAPTEKSAADKGLVMMMKTNPFTTKEAISQYFRKSLEDYLNGEFKDYCTAEDYYQPVCEDFEVDYYVSQWCKEHGFELVSCDGEGGDDGFEPKYWRSWY